jgi:hypothetical protein
VAEPITADHPPNEPPKAKSNARACQSELVTRESAILGVLAPLSKRFCAAHFALRKGVRQLSEKIHIIGSYSRRKNFSKRDSSTWKNCRRTHSRAAREFFLGRK